MFQVKQVFDIATGGIFLAESTDVIVLRKEHKYFSQKENTAIKTMKITIEIGEVCRSFYISSSLIVLADIYF